MSSDTGEVIAEGYGEVTEETLEALKENGFNAVNLLAGPDANDPGVLENTLRKDPSESEEDALTRIYNLLRPRGPSEHRDRPRSARSPVFPRQAL